MESAPSSSYRSPCCDLVKGAVSAVLKCLGLGPFCWPLFNRAEDTNTHQDVSYRPPPSTKAPQDSSSASERGMKTVEYVAVKSITARGRRPKSPPISFGGVAGNLIILQRWTKDQSWNFSSFQIWAQILGLPEEALQVKVAQRLVYKIGTPSQLVIIEGVIQGQRSSYLRVRVIVEINKPLRHSINIQRKNGQKWIAKVKYERVPSHCFFCGMIGHDQTRCKVCFEADQGHFASHGCDPLARCPDLPKRLYGVNIKGNPPSAKLLEGAKYLELQGENTEELTLLGSSSGENRRNLNRCQEGEQSRQSPVQVQTPQTIIPTIQFPRTINASLYEQPPTIGEQFVQPSSCFVTPTQPQNLPSSQINEGSTLHVNGQPMIPSHVLQNPAMAQLVPQFSSISIGKPSPNVHEEFGNPNRTVLGHEQTII
ncbi:hypothetical protein NE237_027966 [Protea cynaroides]|uniref:Zinc knuckle CX2CX4HX4C domain-containing protein n=1 Tax=Protea cynaroides TaxID=273540 RepID=A0A9Q0GPI4_9MAGN|nr:hypothetical protein NE237_027966 [Protea cynaroides]